VKVAVRVDSLPVRGDEEGDPEASAMIERNMNIGILMVELFFVLSSREEVTTHVVSEESRAQSFTLV
jgi:hypothetical protein